MSGFDVTMRSQQQVQQGQQFYDSQRYQMMGQTGQAIAQAPAMLQEIALRQQDADMRLALQQQEFQSNAMKLQAMTAIDQADLMREQVRGAKLQNDAIEFDMSTRREQMGMQREQMFDVRFERLVNAIGGGRGAAASGLKVDPDGKRLIPMTAEERAAAAKDTGSTEFNARRNYLQQAYRMANDQQDDEEMARIYEEIKSLGGSPVPRAPKAKPQTPAQQQAQTAQQSQVAEITNLLRPLSTYTDAPADQVMQTQGWRGSQTPTNRVQPQTVDSIVSFVVANQDELHQQAMSSARAGRKNMKVGETPAETARIYLLELLNSQSEWRKLMVNDLQLNGVITPEEAQAILLR
jgi:hypothetical protein